MCSMPRKRKGEAPPPRQRKAPKPNALHAFAKGNCDIFRGIMVEASVAEDYVTQAQHMGKIPAKLLSPGPAQKKASQLRCLTLELLQHVALTPPTGRDSNPLKYRLRERNWEVLAAVLPHTIEYYTEPHELCLVDWLTEFDVLSEQAPSEYCAFLDIDLNPQDVVDYMLSALTNWCQA